MTVQVSAKFTKKWGEKVQVSGGVRKNRGQ